MVAKHSSRLWLILFVGLILLALFAPIFDRFDPALTNPTEQFRPPDSVHWLGTDQFGRDVWSRVVWGTRYSLLSAGLATGIAMTFGLIVGGVAGAFGGWLDWALMRLVDVMLTFPGFLLAMALVTVFGSGLWQVALAVGFALAPAYSRLIRAAVLGVRGQLFIEAAEVLGSGVFRIIIRHLIPNAAAQIVTFSAVIYAWALLDIAALDFLGLIGSPSLPTWGRMLNEGRTFLRIAPWLALAPGAMLTLSVLVVMGLSDAQRDSLPGID